MLNVHFGLVSDLSAKIYHIKSPVVTYRPLRDSQTKYQIIPLSFQLPKSYPFIHLLAFILLILELTNLDPRDHAQDMGAYIMTQINDFKKLKNILKIGKSIRR